MIRIQGIAVVKARLESAAKVMRMVPAINTGIDPWAVALLAARLEAMNPIVQAPKQVASGKAMAA